MTPWHEYVRISDGRPRDLLALSGDDSKCLGWYQWSVDADRSNRLSKVKASWDGGTFMRACCLFPYNLGTVGVIYGDQQGHDS